MKKYLRPPEKAVTGLLVGSEGLFMVDLFGFQEDVLDRTADKTRVAYYLDMGLGKTFIGAEKSLRLGLDVLVVCQKSKLQDWLEHYQTYYPDFKLYDLSKKKELDEFLSYEGLKAGVINYDLIFRRAELMKLRDYTLLLDESSVIQNGKAKRTKFVTEKLKPDNVILLSGTPTGGKYENLYTQLSLLGWKISKSMYWNHYIEYETLDVGFNMQTRKPNQVKVVTGYKNVDRLMGKMRDYGCVFMKTEEVFDLPEQRDITVYCGASKDYMVFMGKGFVTVADGVTLVGDTVLSSLLYSRMLCGSYSSEKLDALADMLASSDDRFVIFYNFTEELNRLKELAEALEKPISEVRGGYKDLTAYEKDGNSVTLIQYQAGAMGLNLQKSHIAVFFSPPMSYELYAQARKRIHRIGQNVSCVYYKMMVRGSVEEDIYDRLAMRKDYTDKLFEGKYERKTLRE